MSLLRQRPTSDLKRKTQIIWRVLFIMSRTSDRGVGSENAGAWLPLPLLLPVRWVPVCLAHLWHNTSHTAFWLLVDPLCLFNWSTDTSIPKTRGDILVTIFSRPTLGPDCSPWNREAWSQISMFIVRPFSAFSETASVNNQAETFYETT